MEPEVHIIEKYFQEKLHCFTMTNIRCKGGKEIDLLAIDPRSLKRFHVESRIAIKFKLRDKATYTNDGRCHRDGIDYFSREKFEHPLIKEKIREIFGTDDYSKILVVWEIEGEDLVEKALAQYGLQLMSLKSIIKGFLSEQKMFGSRDDVLRVMELVYLVKQEDT
ncbi:MAG: hypothetical protein QW445_01630 [Candidatus Bathyarchaeia archaeon]